MSFPPEKIVCELRSQLWNEYNSVLAAILAGPKEGFAVEMNPAVGIEPTAGEKAH